MSDGRVRRWLEADDSNGRERQWNGSDSSSSATERRAGWSHWHVADASSANTVHEPADDPRHELFEQTRTPEIERRKLVGDVGAGKPRRYRLSPDPRLGACGLIRSRSAGGGNKGFGSSTIGTPIPPSGTEISMLITHAFRWRMHTWISCLRAATSTGPGVSEIAWQFGTRWTRLRIGVVQSAECATTTDDRDGPARRLTRPMRPR